MAHEQLKLNNQLCFPVYAASRLIIRAYQPLLDVLELTYPQYLVLLVLWESDGISIKEIGQQLILNTNTITPLLKRMETLGFVERSKSASDERMVIVRLTEKGRALETKASCIPEKLLNGLQGSAMSTNRLIQLRDELNELLVWLKKDETPEE